MRAAGHDSRPRLTLACAFMALVLLMPGVARAGLAGKAAEPCGVPASLRSLLPAPESLYSAPAYDRLAASALAPWLAKLEVVERDLPGGLMAVQNCVGTVLDREWVLTAAHCLQKGFVRIEVIAGASDIADPRALRRGAVDAVCHSGFNPETMENDIALVRLDPPLPADVPHVRLGGAHEDGAIDAVDGALALSLGWPRIATGRVGDHARHVLTRYKGRDSAQMIVTSPMQDESAGYCLGDSGGPLLVAMSGEARQIGVFAAIQEDRYDFEGHDPETTDCNDPTNRLLFAPVARYRGWIDTVRALCSREPAACAQQ